MYTTHGDHIPGTRQGDLNLPSKSARCGGVEQCPDCMAEAAAITGLDYSREEFYDDQTLTRVFQFLCEAGATPKVARYAITSMQNQGILFRERNKT